MEFGLIKGAHAIKPKQDSQNLTSEEIGVKITTQTLSEVVSNLYEKAVKILPSDVVVALKKAFETESNTLAKQTLELILENVETAKQSEVVICQDTGLPKFFVRIGSEFKIKGNILEAIRIGTADVTRRIPLISHCVDPFTRVNTGTNTGHRVPIVHYSYGPQADYLEITAMPVSARSEVMSTLKVFKLKENIESIRRFVIRTASEVGVDCPPVVIGIGIGGTYSSVAQLAEEATLRDLASRNSDPEIASLEESLLRDINMLRIGTMNLGGDNTALAVAVETADTHTPCTPVAVKVQCWCLRRATARIYSTGKVEFLGG